ncbi:MAG: phosphate ABC transporter permease PstA [Gammaproteobacteria bacterium]|nr:phosphate ABC transporter permease PstA [Gammaproteobacteria bacterium]
MSLEKKPAVESHFKSWWKSGAPWIWLNAGAVSISVVVVFGLLALIASRGMSHFWPSDIQQMQYQTAAGEIRIIGEQIEHENIAANQFTEIGLGAAPEGVEYVKRWLIKTGNRDILPADFRWIDDHHIKQIKTPEDLIVVERVEWGDFYGYLKSVSELGKQSSTGETAWSDLEQRLQRVLDLRDEQKLLEKSEIGAINYQLERLRLKRRGHELDGTDSKENLAEIAAEEKALDDQYQALRSRLESLLTAIARDSAQFEVMDGSIVEVPLKHMVSVLKPNGMNVFEKLGYYFINFKNFMIDDPREANTEGGVFPAIFGTVMMVLLMSILVTPLGVVAAVYLREYARQGAMIRIIRIAVNNLAGVPSIVYGVFGLGFFVYFLGHNLDRLFFPEAMPAPTFGTPGLMWASITLALLTLPVVIVSTEEGLARIPSSFREGSLALGATKFETLWKVVLPMSSPAIMTGLILAVARAAGEVAPLMLVGVVKLAPELPVDGNVPFVHLERKFMHLGFHIYDVGFQSPNVEAARPLVYATAFLLVLVIVLLNLSAIMLRNRLREKYKALDS